MHQKRAKHYDADLGVVRFFLDLRYLRIIFASVFLITQFLDGLSTILALSANGRFYEVNPVLRGFLSSSDNIALTVIAYQLVTSILVLGIILLIDMRNEHHWKKKSVRFLLRETYIIATIMLGILRLIFVVIPNFLLIT